LIRVRLRIAYGTEPPSWVKIKNVEYSQAKDRHERFEKMRARRAAVAATSNSTP
jgi:hypothetical protein